MLRTEYATASLPAVAAFVARHYDLAGSLDCALLHRGINDSYAVRTADAGYVLRLSNHARRADADRAAETAFLAYLDAAGLPVAVPLPARDGRLWSTADMPEGPRGTVLFRHIEGRVPELDDPADARAQGIALARIHDAADRYEQREAGAYRVDLEHLLCRPLAAILALGLAPSALADIATRLAAMVMAAPGLTRTRCHGDCHGLNARIHAGQAVLFDFDDGGFGYLAYDLAVHLWAQLSFGRRRHAMWHAFIAGYRSVRPIAPADLEAVHLFVPIRHIWLMGEYAGRVTEWGTEMLSATWLKREVAFLAAWEHERLSPGLV